MTKPQCTICGQSGTGVQFQIFNISVWRVLPDQGNPFRGSKFPFGTVCVECEKLTDDERERLRNNKAEPMTKLRSIANISVLRALPDQGNPFRGLRDNSISGDARVRTLRRLKDRQPIDHGITVWFTGSYDGADRQITDPDTVDWSLLREYESQTLPE